MTSMPSIRITSSIATAHTGCASAVSGAASSCFRLDAATGKPPPGELRMHSLASRPVPERALPARSKRRSSSSVAVTTICLLPLTTAAEGRAARTTSSSAVRARVIGPYVGRDGKSMLDGYGTLLLQGNRRFRGAGTPAVLRDGNRDYLVYHAYDAQHDGTADLAHLATLVWTDDGWPTQCRIALIDCDPVTCTRRSNSRSSMSARPSGRRRSSTMYR